MTVPLPGLIVIGAMKCATTSLHRYLDQHPDIGMARAKELNFFFAGSGGNWHRGIEWYASQFPSDARIRAEVSPGYTSPSHPEVAERMAATIPDVRLVMLVRDPVGRAVSQYHHHRREGTERRPIDEALLDPDSQYISRGRYAERLRPFLERFPLDRIAIVETEDLDTRPVDTVRDVCRFAGIDVGAWRPRAHDRHNSGDRGGADIDGELRRRLRDAFADDVARLREVTGRRFERWSV